MSFTKITNAQLNSRGATTLPNQPTISASALKQEFDAPAKNIVAPAVNNLIDELEAVTSATSLGATAPTGRTGATVQAVLNDLSSDLTEVELVAHTHSNKTYIDKISEDGSGNPLYDGNPIGAGAAWGDITGTLSAQTDLNTALSGKSDTGHTHTKSDITDFPSLATVATSGSYNDLNNKPSIPTVTDTYSSTSSDAMSGKAVASAISTKSTVGWTQIITTGQKIATISVDGTPTDVYAPTGGGGGGGAVDSVNGQTGTVVLDLDDINDTSIASLADQDTLVYNGTAGTWGNEPLADVALTGSYNDLDNTPTIPTKVSDLNNDSGYQTASDVTTAINALDGSISGSPGVGKTLTAFSETNGVVSATFGDISITKSQVSDFPTIPAAAKDGTLTIQKNGTTVQTFTANQESNATANITTDEWHSTEYTTLDGTTVTFSGLDDTLGYELYCENKLVGISSMSKTGSGTSVTLTYTVTGATIGDKFKLRIIK